MAKKSKKRSASFGPKSVGAPSEQKSLNPFELQVNKVKHNVLGRKVLKSEIGRPSKSRHEAFKKRKETLLHEYKRKDKKSKFVDNRIKDEQGGFAARKAKVWQMKMAPEKSEEASLTHRGRALNQDTINERLESDDEDEFNLLTRADYVESAHFGGGEDGKARSQAEFMTEILDEKRRRHQEKEDDYTLTEELDQNWQTVRNLIRHKNVQREEDDEKKGAYDILVKELMFSSAETPKAKDGNELEQPRKIPLPPHLPRGRVFDDKITAILDTDVHKNLDSLMLSTLECREFNSLTRKNVDRLVSCLKKIECSSFDLQSFTILTTAACVKHLRQKVQIKLIETLRVIKLVTLSDRWKSLLLCEVLLLLTPEQYVPELIRTVQNMLILCTPTPRKESFDYLYIPEFDLFTTGHVRLDIANVNDGGDAENADQQITPGQAFSDDKPPSAGSFLIRLVSLLESVAYSYKTLPAFSEIFLDIQKITGHLAEEAPEKLKEKFEAVLGILETSAEKKTSVAPKKRPYMLPMLEPKMEYSKGKDESENKRAMLRKYKREFKGAQRELRKDSVFIKKTWLDETMEKDKQRKKKVNILMSELAGQQKMFKKSNR